MDFCNRHAMLQPSLAFLVATLACQVVNAAVVEKRAPASQELVKQLKRDLVSDPNFNVDAFDLDADLKIIASSIEPLLELAWKYPPLEGKLTRCVRTLMKKAPKGTQEASELRKEHEAAIQKCRNDFLFYCATLEEKDLVGRCLSNIGIYYAPLASLNTTRTEELETSGLDSTWEEKVRAVAPYAAGAVALILVAAGIRRYYRNGEEESSDGGSYESDFAFNFDKSAFNKGRH